VRAQECIRKNYDQPLIFGFLPVLSPKMLIKRFSPLVDYLSDTLNRPIQIETAPNFKEFIRRTQKTCQYDILLTAPHLYILAHHEAGYRSLVQVSQPSMRAIILVPRNSPIKTLNDLRGKMLATTDSVSLASILVRKRIIQAGLDPDHDLHLINTPSHNASLLSTLRGATDASALMEPPFKLMPPDMRKAMRIIAATISTPHVPISTAPWVSEATSSQILEALSKLNTLSEGKILLKHLNWPGFMPADYSDYKQLEWAVEELEWE
jgi:phosphonate transport system substrate-binding protein